MQLKAVRLFLNSVGALLLIVGTAMFVSDVVNIGFVAPRDPFFRVSMAKLFIIVGVIELYIGLFCFFGRQIWIKLCLVWLWALLSLAYLFSLCWIVGPYSYNGFWNSFSESVGISSFLTFLFLTTLFVYLLVGSSISIFFQWRPTREQKTISDGAGESMVITCQFCGERNTFSAQDLNKAKLCKKCKNIITSQMTADLRRSCILCGGSIEFSTLVQGQSARCPHCQASVPSQDQSIHKNIATPKPTLVRFSCINPACQQHILVDLSWCGKQTQCPSCGTILQVPTFSFLSTDPASG